MKEIKKWVLDFVKIKNFCSAKDTVKRMKKKHKSMGENICHSHIREMTYIQNIQRILKTQQEENKQTNLKNGKREISEMAKQRTPKVHSFTKVMNQLAKLSE